ncbi:hypothetical protein ASE27_09220 [Oerskovia sp. Root918]|uniref:DUF2207 domain-containing protein n=1 Tax=unclassified Oerskovia TaxID=2619021 RepID=UPI0006F5CEE2|nr:MULTISPECIES: DUF2207 domain-containing protein [unclassified Oerskovia]KRC35410.1 hypothetical protein ASE15_09560 [Oerskovia sp. Root22]KRD36661.1 hypothetical protein ASE27_09220 [Oerskovia sp. Root918]
MRAARAAVGPGMRARAAARARLLGLAAVATALSSLVLAPVAAADVSDRAVTRYDVAAQVERDGTMGVSIDMDYDFRGDEGHGPTLVIPTLFEIDGDPDHLRRYEVSDVRASSDSGAAADVEVEDQGGGDLLVRVGSADRTFDGLEQYTITYTLRGLVNPGVGAEGQDEIYWNVLPDTSEIDIENASVTLDGPGDVSRTSCFAGPGGSTDPCTASSATGTVASFTQADVPAGTFFTVLAEYPAGTFEGAEPVVVDRAQATGERPFEVTPVSGGLTALLLGGGAWFMVHRVRQRGRDEQYLGLVPGTVPVAGDDARVGPRDRRLPVAVQFTPPAASRPGEIGTLVDERADPHDVTATIVDLAVRGHLQIVEVEAPSKRGKGGDWRLDRLAGPDEELLGFERTLLDKIFAGRESVTLSDLRTTFAASMALVQSELYAEVTRRGWFRANPRSVRNHWLLAGMVLLVGGVVLALVLGAVFGSTWALVAAPVAVLGVLALVLCEKAPARTAEGTAVLTQTLGFRRYLETAEAGQLRFEEGEDVFSRYLPYAIVFGVADRWAGIFARLAAQGQSVAEPTWYVGPGYGPGMFWVGYSSFGSSLTAFSDAATTSISAATPSSSGDSGFSSGGGFSGGGGGGGGGVGGW